MSKVGLMLARIFDNTHLKEIMGGNNHRDKAFECVIIKVLLTLRYVRGRIIKPDTLIIHLQ